MAVGNKEERSSGTFDACLGIGGIGAEVLGEKGKKGPGGRKARICLGKLGSISVGLRMLRKAVHQ